jgi:hypothetical protein
MCIRDRKSAAAEVLFKVLGLETTFAGCLGFAAGFGCGFLITGGTGSLWKPTFTTGFAIGLVTGLVTGLATILVGALTGDLTGAFTVVDLAGVTETAEAQIVTLPPLTCEPNLFEPDEPPEFLQLARLGCGAKTNRQSITAKPKMEFIFTGCNMARSYRRMAGH